MSHAPVTLAASGRREQAMTSPAVPLSGEAASGVIDAGIEILPMKEMERQMSSGVPYYERDLANVLRQGRGVPGVPLVLVGIAP